jgi:hypothetical protein
MNNYALRRQIFGYRQTDKGTSRDSVALSPVVNLTNEVWFNADGHYFADVLTQAWTSN